MSCRLNISSMNWRFFPSPYLCSTIYSILNGANRREKKAANLVDTYYCLLFFFFYNSTKVIFSRFRKTHIIIVIIIVIFFSRIDASTYTYTSENFYCKQIYDDFRSFFFFFIRPLHRNRHCTASVPRGSCDLRCQSSSLMFIDRS